MGKLTEQHMRVDLLAWYGMVISATFPKAVGLTAAIMARHAGRGIWLAELAAIIAAMVLLTAAAAAMVRLRTGVVASLEQAAGPWAARPVALVQALFFALVYLGGAYSFVGHVQYYFLPETPLLVFLIAGGTLAVVGSHYGFEVLARMAVVGALGHVAVTALTVPGVAWDVNLLQLWPVNERGWPALATATGAGLADLMQPIGLAVAFLPAVAGRARHVAHTALAAAAAGLLVGIWPLGEILVLGPVLTAHQALSCMALARATQLGTYIQRYELVMLLFFLPGVFLAQALPLYALSGALRHALQLRSERGLYLPMAVLLTGATHWVLNDRLQADRFFTRAWPPAVIILGLCLLLAAVAAALAKGRTAGPGTGGRGRRGGAGRAG